MTQAKTDNRALSEGRLPEATREAGPRAGCQDHKCQLSEGELPGKGRSRERQLQDENVRAERVPRIGERFPRSGPLQLWQ